MKVKYKNVLYILILNLQRYLCFQVQYLTHLERLKKKGNLCNKYYH